MMITGATPNCYPNNGPIYEEFISSSLDANSSAPVSAHPSSFLYNLSILKDKVHQVQSLAAILLSPDHHGQPPESTAITMPTMGTLIQEIIVTASSMMFACQQMALGNNNPVATTTFELHHHRDSNVNPSSAAATGGDGDGGSPVQSGGGPSSFFSNHHDPLDHWYGAENYSNNCNSSTDRDHNHNNNQKKLETDTKGPAVAQGMISPKKYDIVELDAADLLAKYTHYCQVCGKGFKRDANLRMHMRAHGDEYKSSAALSNPMKHQNNNNSNNTRGGDSNITPRKYSCPHEGCRWNKNHAKFQPLKSMICVKNHYKRSHCPKMYVCKRCNRKQFSVLSDLRTHEKHCGDLKWQCSCGTTFSRKDKLMGHVALFVGHTPAITTSLTKIGSTKMQMDHQSR